MRARAGGGVLLPDRPSAAATAEPALRFRDVAIAFGTHDGKKAGRYVAVRDVSFEVPARGFVAVVGPSGCGKSTLLNVAAGLLAPVLGWSEVQTEREVGHYLARVEAERLSQEQPDDQTADTARLGAPEIVPLS